MFDSRRYLSTFAVFALVLLRLVIGWHFFREGTQKIVYDRHDGELRMNFSSEGFLKNAKGPLAPMYKSSVPSGHDWQAFLAQPRQNTIPTDEQTAEQARWLSDYELRRAAAKNEGKLSPVEFPEPAPYREWAERIAADWRKMVDDVKAVPAMSDEQDKQADKALNTRLQDLANYLSANEEAITEYRHELWRLANWRESPEHGQVPFVDARIATKTTETGQSPGPWLSQVNAFENQLRDDLRKLLTPEQRESPRIVAAVDGATAEPGASRLRLVDTIVTILTISVGLCLLLGLFTRTAAMLGALFLLSVILAQPPWVADAAPTMPQIIEFAALLVLAGTAAGRWAGLDFFLHSWSKSEQTA